VLWERSVVEQRYDAVIEVVRDGLPVSLVAERYGVARQSVHAWLGRFRAGRAGRPVASAGLVPASDASGGGGQGAWAAPDASGVGAAAAAP
jgi:transposase